MMNRCISEPCKATCATEPCNVLGPYPVTVIAALADLGLTDQEIAGYFRIQPDQITQFRLKGVPELRFFCHGDAPAKLDLDRE